MMRKRSRSESGFTLIELMIAVAIIAILAAVALPMYNDYIATSREGALVSSISTIRVFQEDFRLRNNAYSDGSYNGGVADADLQDLGWDPERDDVDYVIVANGNVSFEVTATDETGYSVCREYPSGDPC